MMSERFSTTLRLCSTIRTVRFAATRLISAEMRSTSSWAIPAVGSSSSIISGSSASVVAISRARLRPYGSSTAGVCANAARPTASISSIARPFRPSSTRSDRQKSNEAPRLRWSATRTFSRTERWGNTAEIWNERTRPGRRIEARLPPLLPGAVGLVHLPGRHALALRPQHVLEQPARIAVERLVEQPLGVSGRGGRGAARLPDDGRERPVEVGVRTHPVDEADGARLGGAHVVVQERQLLGAPHTDDARQA